MIPLAPEISIRTLTQPDASALAPLLNRTLNRAPFSMEYNPTTLVAHLMDEVPFSVGAVVWHTYLLIGAWRAGELIGFMDAATGIPPAEKLNVDIRENRSISPGVDIEANSGLLRMFILPEREALVATVAAQLFQRAEEFWLNARVQDVYAFKMGTGYPFFQAGAGVLPGDWSDHFRFLTEHGYRLEQRYRVLRLTLTNYCEEIYPDVGISLAMKSLPCGWEAILYHRRIQRIGYMRIFGETLFPEAKAADGSASTEPAAVPIATIAELYVNAEWRGKGLGKLLMRRAINDAYHRGFQSIIVYLNQSQHVAWSMFTQQGFQELSFNGYSFVKTLKSV